MVIVFHDCSTIFTRVKHALFWPHFRLFPTVVMLVLCPVPVLVLFIMSFCFEYPIFFVLGIVFITGGG